MQHSHSLSLRSPMSPYLPLPHFPATPRSPGVLAAVVLAHAGVLALLLTEARTPQPPLTPPTPLFVRMIELPSVQPAPAAAPQPPKPQPAPKPKPAPVLAATPTVPQPVAVPAPQPPQPEPPAELPQPAPMPAPAPVPSEAPRPAAAPQPLVAPRFNAEYLDNPKPAYPSISRRMGEEGEVRLRVYVDTAGAAQQVEIERSSGFPRLDQAALETVKRWRFVPARQGNQPVAAWVIVPIQFTLRS